MNRPLTADLSGFTFDSDKPTLQTEQLSYLLIQNMQLLAGDGFSFAGLNDTEKADLNSGLASWTDSLINWVKQVSFDPAARGDLSLVPLPPSQVTTVLTGLGGLVLSGGTGGLMTPLLLEMVVRVGSSLVSSLLDSLIHRLLGDVELEVDEGGEEINPDNPDQNINIRDIQRSLRRIADCAEVLQSPGLQIDLDEGGHITVSLGGAEVSPAGV